MGKRGYQHFAMAALLQIKAFPFRISSFIYWKNNSVIEVFRKPKDIQIFCISMEEIFTLNKDQLLSLKSLKRVIDELLNKDRCCLRCKSQKNMKTKVKFFICISFKYSKY